MHQLLGEKKMVIKTAKEKESMVAKMLNDGCTYRQIEKACNVSPNFISPIKKKLTGEEPAEPMFKKAYRLFETKRPYGVAMEPGIRQPEVSEYYSEYLILNDLEALGWLYHALGHQNINQLKSLHDALARKGVKPTEYATFIGKANKIDNLVLEEEKSRSTKF